MKQYLTTLLSAVMIGGTLPCSGEVPRPEHPRPDQFRENWVTLNGEWQFEIDEKAYGETRGLTHGKDLDDRIIVPFCPESKLSGLGYMYSAMADLARFSEAPEYAAVVEKLWQDVVGRKLYLTGGLGTAQYGDEGFGDPYLLPNKTYCESCASIAHVFWQHRMNLLKGDAKYADVLELVLYNSALSGMSLSGDSFFYQNPLESRTGAERSKWIGLACCPTNLSRFTPQVGGLVYARDNGKIHVNLYAAGVASIDIGGGRAVKICQETNYPWDGRIRLTIGLDKPTEFDLCVRIPGWALGKPVPGDLYRFASTEAAPVSLKVNGEPVEAKSGQDGYVHLKRSWKPGDKVELDLPMPVRRVLAHEKIEANKGKVALMRGPIVYCLEGADNKDIDLFKLSLPRSADLTAEHDKKLLGGVTTLHASGFDEKKTTVKLTAIPYFAWANREKGPMTIWINESVDEKPGPGAANRWSAEKANEWYSKQPWPCGFNYVPAHAISYTEMWMPYNFDVSKMDKELALAEDVGFNCLRVVLPFVVWEHDPAAFKKRLDEFLSFHNYHNSGKVAAEIAALKAHGRPIINTEWLCRHQDSTPEACLPLFARENVGCMHWGLVNGKSQTHLHWGARPDKPEPKVWQHDLFHGDYKPYDSEELKLFRHTIREQGK